MDTTSNAHGASLVRFKLSESLVKEALSLSSSFLPTPTSGTSLDANMHLTGMLKAHLSMCGEKRVEAKRDDELIYHSILPLESALPVIAPLAAATPLSIAEIWAQPHIQQLIGKDLFEKLIPLSVHEAASVYSEEKAKVGRGESERCELADVELSTGLEFMGLPGGLEKYKSMIGRGSAGGGMEALKEPTREAREWSESIRREEGGREGGVDSMDREIAKLRDDAGRNLDKIGKDLDEESRICESNRVSL